MAIKDFQAKQLRSSRLIVSQSRASEPPFLIYSASSAGVDFAGNVAGSVLANVGTDVFMFVSGSISTGSAPNPVKRSRSDVTLFGGDVVVSGTLFAERQVIDVDGNITGNLHVSGSGIFLGKVVVNDSGYDQYLEIKSGTFPGGIPTAPTDGSILYVRNNGGTKTLYFKNSDDVERRVGENAGSAPDLGWLGTKGVIYQTGSLGIGEASPTAKLDVEATTEQLRLKYDDTNVASFTVDIAGELTLDTTADIILDPGGGDVKLTDGDAFHTDKVRAIDGDGLALYDDGGGGIFIKDGGSVGIGLTAPLSEVHVYSADNATVLIDSHTARSGSVAFAKNAAGNGTAAALTLDADESFVLVNSGANENIVFKVNLYGLGSDPIKEALKIDGSGAGVIVNSIQDDYIDFRVATADEDEALYVDASENELYINKGNTAFATIIGSTNEEAIRVNADGVIFNETGHATNDFRVETGTKEYGLFVNAGAEQVFILSGTSGNPGDSPDESTYTDTAFFVSGTRGSKGTAIVGTSLFGGDLHISGNLSVDGTRSWDLPGEGNIGWATGSAGFAAGGGEGPDGWISTTGSLAVTGSVWVNTSINTPQIEGGPLEPWGGGVAASNQTLTVQGARGPLILESRTSGGWTKKVDNRDGGIGVWIRTGLPVTSVMSNILIEPGNGGGTWSAGHVFIHGGHGGTLTTFTDTARRAGNVTIEGGRGAYGRDGSLGDYNVAGGNSGHVFIIGVSGSDGDTDDKGDGLSGTNAGSIYLSASHGGSSLAGDNDGGNAGSIILSASCGGAGTGTGTGGTSGDIQLNVAHGLGRVLIMSGGAPGSTDDASGADVAFFVSGTVGSKSTSVRGSSLFGGDVIISGSLTVSSPGVGTDVIFYGEDSDAIGLQWDADSGDHGKLILGQDDHGVDFQVYGEDTNNYVSWAQSTNTLSLYATQGAINTKGNIVFDIASQGWDFTVNTNNKIGVFVDGDQDQVFILSGTSGNPGDSPDESTYTDVAFFVSGTAGSRTTTTKGVALFGGDLHISGNLTVDGTSPSGGGAGAGVGWIAPSQDVISTTGSVFFGVSGGSSNPDITFGRNGAANFNVQSQDADFRVGSQNKQYAILVDASADQVLILSGGAAASTHEADGDDVNFYVSGTVGSITTAVRGTSLFGGDMAVSGSVKTFSGLNVGGNILPTVDSSYNLGSEAYRFANIYTGDLHLRNERGNWTIVEEADYLCVVNNITGKKYKMLLEPL